MDPKPKVVILGAGISGLALAAELAPAFDVSVLEASDRSGGLARTIRRDGFRLDLGPRPLYATRPDNARIVEILKSKLGGDLRAIDRNSGVWFNGRVFPYPLKMRQMLSKLTLPETILHGLSFLRARFELAVLKRQAADFSSWVISRYGRKVYRLYFEEYTSKAWGMKPESLSALFASERVPETTLTVVLLETITGRKPSFSPDHPHNPQRAASFFPRYGAGMIPEALEREALGQGARLHLRRKAVALKRNGHSIEGVIAENGQGRELFPCDYLASTIPLPELAGLLTSAETADKLRRNLPYSPLTFVFLFFKKEKILRHNWIYFPEPYIPFNRVSEIKNCSPSCAPRGATCLCLELSPECARPPAGGSDSGPAEIALDALAGLGLIDQREGCYDSLVMTESQAYCLWLRGFEPSLREARDAVGSCSNLLSFGRQGEFQYYNMDQCLVGAEAAAGRIRRFFRGPDGG